MFRPNPDLYEKISDDGNDIRRYQPRIRSYWIWGAVFLTVVLYSLALMAVGAFLGKVYNDVSLEASAVPGSLSYPEPEGSTTKTFQLDQNYVGPPSPSYEQHWESLVPAGRGFFQHPVLGEDIQAFTVFHQIHCLYSINMAWWTVAQGGSPNETHHGLPLTAHVAHCVEFIRQALLCHADTNLEVVDRRTNASTGWGTNRVCRDIDAVRRFAETYRITDDGKIV